MAASDHINRIQKFPQWWQDRYDEDDDTSHIKGVDGDFLVVDKNWTPSDRSDLIWHGSPARIEDDYVSSARSRTGGSLIGSRYSGYSDEELNFGGMDHSTKVWGGSPRIAKEYSNGNYIYGLDVRGPIETTFDGYAFDEDENEIVERYKYEK